MKIETLKEVQKLTLELEQMIDKSMSKTRADFKYGGDFDWYNSALQRGELRGGKDAASIKRKSMDLTRALAKLRKGE